MITGLDHVQLAMPPGRETEVRVFCALLGMAEIPKPETLAARGGVWLSLSDGRQVHYGVTADFEPAKKAHPAFVVDDLDGLANRLENARYEVTWDDALAPRRRFYSEDPFGNRLEFMEIQE